jgi:small subunit ribosomal protein S19
MEENQVRKKELKFKGKTIEELKNLGVREFAKLLRSRQRRTVLRNFQEHENFVKRVNSKLEKGKKSIKTHRRDLVIVPGLIDKRIQIYNGREFIPIDVTIEMLGHKLGEFAPTRAKAKHIKDGKKK